MWRARRSRRLATENASGAVATRGGEVVGYLLGTPREDPTWGPNVWVEPAGHAVTRAEDVRDLYALAAARWVEEGRTSHYAVAPAGDAALVDAWFRLGFGQQHVYALREAPETPLTELPDGIEIRRPTRDEIPVLAELELALPAHQHASPVFSPLGPPPLEEAISEWEEDFDDPKYATFVAVVDGRVVGSAIGCSIDRLQHAQGARATRTTPGSSASPPSSRRHAAPASAGRSARPCSTGRRPRATRGRRHRLAGDEPAVVAHLAEARVSPDVSAACSARSPSARGGRGCWLDGGRRAFLSSRAPGCRSSRWTTTRCS